MLAAGSQTVPNRAGASMSIDTLALVELIGLAVALALGVRLARRRPAPWRPAWRWFGRLARRRWLAICLVGLLATLGSAGLSLFVYHTEPFCHDQFAYLLAADTFAHGRVTNPTHPLWVHFETFHVIHRPTYMAKYPPGQGLVLAAAQVVAGSPLVGVWVSLGLCCGAICWMLQGWLPPRWALLGALLATGRLVFSGMGYGAVGYWGNTYWGGGVAALGGALVFGAVRRLLDRPSVGYSAVLGVGLVVLANSRPYEGLVVSLPVLVLLLGWLAGKHGPALGVALRRVVLPLGLVLLPAGAAMAYYNARITGSPVRMPYQLHEATYAVTPLFLWQHVRPEPAYNHAVLRSFHAGWACEPYRSHQSPAGVVRMTADKLQTLWKFFLGVTLAIPFVALTAVAHDRWFRFAVLAGAALLLGMLLVLGVTAHYAAPAAGLVYLIAVQGLRHLRVWRWQGRPVGRGIACGVVLNSAVLCVAAVAYAAWTFVPDDWSQERAAILRQLRNTPEEHLVLVRYAAGHREDQEWVYDEADIDRARVVWARERGNGLDGPLLEHFRGRRVWLLEADVAPARVVPYSTKSAASGATVATRR
jgi:hypothetical protein